MTEQPGPRTQWSWRPASYMTGHRMGACETTPPATRRGTPTPPASQHERNLPRSDDPPPLGSVQLVRPRRYAAAGAPAGPHLRSDVNPGSYEEDPEEQPGQPGREHARHWATSSCPLDNSGPHGCRIARVV